MNLLGRRIHFAGSVASDADERKVRYAHRIITELTSTLLQKRATFVIPFGKEPLLRDEAGMPPVIFDWTVAEAIVAALDAKSAKASGTSGRLIATISTTKTDSNIPPHRKGIYDQLRAEDAIDIKFLRAGWSAGAVQRQKLSEIGDVLIILSGGQGVEHLAVEYSSRGKPVIPLDLQLGSFSRDGSGGAARLFDRALENPDAFFRVDNESSAADLLDKTRTGDGTTDASSVVGALANLLDHLKSPQAFYVRILNKDLPDYASVEVFFRGTVDSLISELGYERCEMGIGRNEFAWMNEAIFQSLHHSSVVIVDITGVRPNCFIELGYALGNHQKIIFTARDGTSFPFDVFALEAFIWKDNEDPTVQLNKFRTHWQRNINMPRLVRPNEAR